MMILQEVKNAVKACALKKTGFYGEYEQKEKRGCEGDCSGCPCKCSLSTCSFTLNQAEVGEFVRIKALKDSGEKFLKLMELGLLPGMDVMVRERAPFGGPLLVYVLGTILAIRESEAAQIIVEKKQDRVLS